MIDPESPESKNEQELNLFADQTRPEDNGAAAEQPAQVARESDVPDYDDDAPVVAPPPAFSARNGAPVIAPPPQRNQQSVRPGIVVPPPERATFTQPARPPAAPASPARDAGHKPLPHPIQQNQSLGQALTAIRNARGLSLEEVALSTRIRMEYLLELEADELLKTLPTVYVSAYVRKLAEVYDLSREDSEALIEIMRGEIPHDPEELPNKLIESVNEGGMVNEEENKRFQKLAIVFLSLVALFVVALVYLVIHLFSSSSSSAPAPVGQDPAVRQAEEPLSQTIRMDESELDALIAPEMPSSSILKMSKTPGIRDTK